MNTHAPRIAATVLSAALLSLIAPPANLHWLHWVAYLPMFWVLREDTPKANRWYGFLYGLVGVGLIFRWLVATISIFSNLPSPVAVAILGLFAAVFGLPWVILWPAVHTLRRRLGPAWVLALPALQVLIEWASMHLLLFPYSQGVSQYRVPYVWQLVSVTGVWGSSYLIFLVNSVLAESIYRHREGRPPPIKQLALLAAAMLCVVSWGAWRYWRVEAQLQAAPVLKVAQLQSDKGMEYRMSHPTREAFDEWTRQTVAIPRGAAELVVWPEGACPYTLNRVAGRSNRAADLLGNLAKSGDFEFIVGGGSRMREADKSMGESRVRVFNSVYWFKRDGAELTHYDKMVPLPFGEYLPFGSYLPWLAEAIGGIGDFKAGTEAVVFEGETLRVATPICYEAILPGVCRRFVNPDLFVNVTNDAWFGDTAATHQHAMLAAIRATELGVPLFRSAYTGVSMVVDPHGAISYETEPFTQVNRIVPVRMAHIDTIYARYGDWFVWLCALGLMGAWGTTRHRTSV